MKGSSGAPAANESRYAPGPPRRNSGGGGGPAPMSLHSAAGAGEFDIHEHVRQGMQKREGENAYPRTTIDRRSGVITTGTNVNEDEKIRFD